MRKGLRATVAVGLLTPLAACAGAGRVTSDLDETPSTIEQAIETYDGGISNAFLNYTGQSISQYADSHPRAGTEPDAYGNMSEILDGISVAAIIGCNSAVTEPELRVEEFLQSLYPSEERVRIAQEAAESMLQHPELVIVDYEQLDPSVISIRREAFCTAVDIIFMNGSDNDVTKTFTA